MTPHPPVEIDANVFMLPRLPSRHGIGVRHDLSTEKGLIPMLRELPAQRAVEVSVSGKQQVQPSVVDAEPGVLVARPMDFARPMSVLLQRLPARRKENRH